LKTAKGGIKTMQNYTTILGVIKLRSENVPYDVVQKRYSIGSSTVTLIMRRFREVNLTYYELSQMEPAEVVALFYPQENLRRKDIPMPDFQYYYDRIHKKGVRSILLIAGSSIRAVSLKDMRPASFTSITGALSLRIMAAVKCRWRSKESPVSACILTG
jgi:hypothetical protein